MRVLRLRLTHFRGIREREVRFAEHGVTIVQGPNEVGKSSLAEALDVLLEEVDNTTKQRVREIQPVDRDAGSEVEAEIRLGDLHFTYHKRFHRRPETHLRQHAPQTRTLTGREAHDQVRAWLEAHVDLALWRALRLDQGGLLAQPKLHEASSLAEALDLAVGAGGGGANEESLFDRVKAAYEEHFTATGRPKRDLLAARKELEAARERTRSARETLEGLERDVAEAASLRRRVAALEAEAAEDLRALRSADAEFERTREEAEACRRLALQRDAAGAREREAMQATRQRSQLVATQAGALAEVESLAEALESEEPACLAAGAEVRHLEERIEAAHAARREAQELLEHARRDAAHRRGEQELGQLREQAARVAREREEAERARAVLAGPAIDAQDVEAIQRAQLEVDRARARLAADGPTVQIEPVVDLEVIVDGRRERLRAGEPSEQRVSEALLMSLPGVGEVRVVAGSAVAERRKLLEQAETRLRTLCVEAGVEGHAGAIAAFTARRAAKQELERSEQRLAQALGVESAGALEERILRLERRLAAYVSERSSEAPLPASLEAAEAALEAAETREGQARDTLDDLTRRRDVCAERFRRTEEVRSDTRNRLDLAERNRLDQGCRLAEARAVVSDEKLELWRDGCDTALRELKALVREASAQLARREPKRVAARARAARDARDRSEKSLRSARESALRVAERLEVMGNDGHFERWQEAERAERRAESAHSTLRRRADAAERLYTVLREERDAARSHYAAPLAERIALLGQSLYGDDFRVELDEDLRVSQRVLSGIALSESQLSAGAREQLALLARLAAAGLAGGVPVWLDDALGHSDAERSAALGPVLAAAGDATQVVVLTCSPERFQHVPGATVVELA